MESKFISVGKEQMHYLQWGSGKRLLLAFHGYGDDAAVFDPLRPYLQQEYTVLSIDLPHHGRSRWNGTEVLNKKDLFLLIAAFCEEFGVSKVSLMGYSMGGRVCLTIIEHLPLSIDRVALLATDGLTVNLYYYFFTKTFVGRNIFNRMLEQPTSYLKMIEWLKKKHLVDGARYKFVMHFLGTQPNRKFLQKVWPNTSDFIPSPAKLRKVIQKYRLPVFIFMGAHDKIIPLSQAKKFSEGLDTVQVFVLDKGHRVFDNETAPQIAARLLQ